MSWWYLVLGLTVGLFGGSAAAAAAAAAANCTENCELCFRHFGCYSCKQGYYMTDGECEKCNPTCKRCFVYGLCHFECEDGWYGQYCSQACSCSYGTCDKHTGFCPRQTDPPVSRSNDDEYYDDDELPKKIFGILALVMLMVILCCRCINWKRNTDEEQMADDITDIIPPSQKLLPGQIPITTRSTNIIYPNYFAGNFTTYTSNNDNSIMCPPQRTDLAPPSNTTHSDQQTDQAPPTSATYSDQQMDQTPPPCATYSSQEMGQVPPPCATYSGHDTDQVPPPCATYSDQQMDQAPPHCATYSGQETVIGSPPSYTARTHMPPPPSYESLFDSKKEHSQD